MRDEEILKFKKQAEVWRHKMQKFYDDFYLFYVRKIYELYEKSEDVPYIMLDEIAVGKRWVMPCLHGKKISTFRLPDSATNVMDFQTNFDPQAVLTKHHHSDCDEAVRVTAGGPFHIQLTRSSDGEVSEKTIYEKGEMVLIPKKVEHQFTNLGKSEGVLLVKFLKS